jgi:hypothetical protein
MNTLLTDKQFALDKAINIYLMLYKEESVGIENLLHKVDGYSVPNKKQLNGILELADKFEKHLKS